MRQSESGHIGKRNFQELESKSERQKTELQRMLVSAGRLIELKARAGSAGILALENFVATADSVLAQASSLQNEAAAIDDLISQGAKLGLVQSD